MEVACVEGLGDLPPGDWDRLNPGADPFLQHAFLAGLEAHGCLSPHGWYPRHLLARAAGRLVGALPLYLKTDSVGEFVFDWSWAEAYERAGGRYYPKLVCAVPFTPVTGPRLLLAPEAPAGTAQALLQAALDLTTRLRLSSLHLLFPQPGEMALAETQGLIRRSGCQYHWHHRGYRDFQDFLDALNSKRRKAIRHERRAVAAAGVEVERFDGRSANADHWALFHAFYCSTFERKWGSPRLTLAFFRALAEAVPDQTLLWLARRDGRYVAGAFALRGPDTLYGRHWGCSEMIPGLHFELCFYRTVEYCIAQGLGRLDAGAQGEHKLARGFEPVATWSGHWIREPGFRRAIADFCRREAAVVDEYMAGLAARSPYRRASGDPTLDSAAGR